MSENYFDTVEWHQKRLSRFTASEIHKLIGKKKAKSLSEGALTYIYTKVAEMLTQEVKEEVDFKQAEWGKANELDAMIAFEAAVNIKGIYYGVANPQFFPYGEWCGGSPDWESVDLIHGADFKCPFNSTEHLKNHFLKSASDLKAKRWEYYCQGQLNMLIRGWQQFHFVSYDPRFVVPRHRLKIITVYPDNQWIEEFNLKLNTAIDKIQEMLNVIDLNFPLSTTPSVIGTTNIIA